MHICLPVYARHNSTSPYWHCYFRRHCIHCQVVCCGLVMFPHVDFNRKVSTGLTGLCEFLQSIGIFLREWCVDSNIHATRQGRYLHLLKTMLRLPCPIGRVEEALHHILSFLPTYSGLSGWPYICQLAVYQLLFQHHGVVMCSVFFNNGQKQLRNHLNQCAATNLYEDTCVSQGDYAYGECGWSGDDDIFFQPRTHNRFQCVS